MSFGSPTPVQIDVQGVDLDQNYAYLAKIETELKAAEHELEQMGQSLAKELAERVLGRPLNGGAATGKNN